MPWLVLVASGVGSEPPEARLRIRHALEDGGLGRGGRGLALGGLARLALVRAGGGGGAPGSRSRLARLSRAGAGAGGRGLGAGEGRVLGPGQRGALVGGGLPPGGLVLAGVLACSVGWGRGDRGVRHLLGLLRCGRRLSSSGRHAPAVARLLILGLLRGGLRLSRRCHSSGRLAPAVARLLILGLLRGGLRLRCSIGRLAPAVASGGSSGSGRLAPAVTSSYSRGSGRLAPAATSSCCRIAANGACGPAAVASSGPGVLRLVGVQDVKLHDGGRPAVAGLQLHLLGRPARAGRKDDVSDEAAAELVEEGGLLAGGGLHAVARLGEEVLEGAQAHVEGEVHRAREAPRVLALHHASVSRVQGPGGQCHMPARHQRLHVRPELVGDGQVDAELQRALARRWPHMCARDSDLLGRAPQAEEQPALHALRKRWELVGRRHLPREGGGHDGEHRCARGRWVPLDHQAGPRELPLLAALGARVGWFGVRTARHCAGICATPAGG